MPIRGKRRPMDTSNQLAKHQTRTYANARGRFVSHKAKPLADLSYIGRLALLRLCDHRAWADGHAFTAEASECVSCDLEELVAAGHLVRIPGATSNGNRRIDAAYQLKPVSVAMVADWRREHG